MEYKKYQALNNPFNCKSSVLPWFGLTALSNEHSLLRTYDAQGRQPTEPVHLLHARLFMAEFFVGLLQEEGGPKTRIAFQTAACTHH